MLELAGRPEPATSIGALSGEYSDSLVIDFDLFGPVGIDSRCFGQDSPSFLILDFRCTMAPRPRANVAFSSAEAVADCNCY